MRAVRVLHRVPEPECWRVALEGVEFADGRIWLYAAQIRDPKDRFFLYESANELRDFELSIETSIKWIPIPDEPDPVRSSPFDEHLSYFPSLIARIRRKLRLGFYP